MCERQGSLNVLLNALEYCGGRARWVLPLGLVAGAVLPWASEPMRAAIAPCIWLLLFLSVVRLHNGGALAPNIKTNTSAASNAQLLCRVLLAQLVFPAIVFLMCTSIGVPFIWCVCATLVAAAPPISGSPSLVLLLNGDGVLALRWLIVATLLLPLTCIPFIYLLVGEQSITGMLKPVIKLLLLIGSATLVGFFLSSQFEVRSVKLSKLALDGASAIVLAVMVVGLMSGIHAPSSTPKILLITLLAALCINLGYQLLGTSVARFLNHSSARIICTGVVNGNRNIALYLTALPASFIEPLLLFVACYQIPMYLTPLLGSFYYRAPE